ncbi:MAG: hypothetical protein R3B09_34645 [Nannocystaceae bacterium]
MRRVTRWVALTILLLPGTAKGEPEALPGVLDEVEGEAAPGEAGLEAHEPPGGDASPGSEVRDPDAPPQAQADALAGAGPTGDASDPEDAPLDDAAVDPPPPPEPGSRPSRAPPSRAGADVSAGADASEARGPAPDAGPMVDTRRRRRDEKIPHRGVIFEVKTGILGCTGALCADASGMGATPGLALDGFVGGNIAGFLDVGFEGGWGRMNARTVDGRNLAEIYGFDVDALTMVIGDDVLADALLSGLTVTGAQSALFHGGPALRLHVVPRGRVSAYVGAGAQYQLWRTRYTTASGDALGVGFHGTSFPLVVGVGGYVHRHIALGVEGRYVPSLYWIASVQSPMLSGPVPISTLERAMGSEGAVRDRLPSFWTLTATARVRF